MPNYIFKTENWAGDFYRIKAEKLTMDILWPYIKGEGWNGKKENYRLRYLGGESYCLESNLNCDVPCDWRQSQIINAEVAA